MRMRLQSHSLGLHRQGPLPNAVLNTNQGVDLDGFLFRLPETETRSAVAPDHYINTLRNIGKNTFGHQTRRLAYDVSMAFCHT